MDIETWIASFKTELSSTFQNALRGTLEAVEVEVNRVLDEKFAALMYDLERRDAISEKVHSWVECRSSRSEVQSPVEDCSLIFQEPEHLSVDAISPHSPKPVALICHQAIAIHEGDQEEDILPHNEGGSEMDMVYIQSTFLEKDWVVSLQQVTNFSSVHSKESDDNYEQCEETELQPVYSIKDDTVLNSSCVKEELSRLAASEIDESDSEQEFVSIAGEVCELGSVCIKEENSESVVAPPMEDMDDIQDIHIKGEASFQQLPESAQDESNNLANKLCIISATSLAEEVPKTEPVSELEQEQEPHLEPVVMLKKQSVSDPMAIMNKITRLEPSVRMKRIPESNLAHLLKDTFEINCTIGIKNSSVSSTTEAEMGPSNVDSTINTEGDSVSHSVEVTIHDLSESDTVVETRENSLSPPPSEQNLDSETPSVLLEMDTFESSYLVDKNGDLTSQSDPGASNSSKLDFSVKENTTYGQNSAAEANENVFSEQGGANSNVQQSDNMTPAVSSTRDSEETEEGPVHIPLENLDSTSLLKGFTDDQLREMLRSKRFEISCMKEPLLFLSSLRDNGVISQYKYEEVNSLKAKRQRNKVIYRLLVELGENPKKIRLFWTLLGNDLKMLHYLRLQSLSCSHFKGKSPSNAVPEGNITKNTTPKLSLQTTENLKRNQEKPNTGLAKKRTRLLLNGTKDLNMFGHPAFCHNKLRGSLRDGVQLGKTGKIGHAVKKRALLTASSTPPAIKKYTRKYSTEKVQNGKQQIQPVKRLKGQSCLAQGAKPSKRKGKKRLRVHYNEERETWKKPVIPVWCGNKKGFLYKDRLGSIPVKKCIKVGKQWYSPMEFEKLGGRESSKNWKKSVKCGSAMLFTLIENGYIKLPPRRKKVESDRSLRLRSKTCV
ncbi:uncharacterized protein LOC120536951 [Polypterus senegalus]|uniref:uncharacterized protein LOC120536951 n=1 Tax=Polypterus senegalus TaxID=55291 RepID=UPI00196572F2|nr:uncharacterized protein LOC120536951 [Polypterus senegalus]